jgi:hypothetical protein
LVYVDKGFFALHVDGFFAKEFESRYGLFNQHFASFYCNPDFKIGDLLSRCLSFVACATRTSYITRGDYNNIRWYGKVKVGNFYP